MTHAEDVLRNRGVWAKANAEYTDRTARESWAKEEIDWGMFSGPEAEINALGDVAAKDVIELGCGTAYFGAWLAKRGARVTGVDPTPAQLETARRMSQEFGVPIELVEASAEDVPLPDESFDLAVSEYGASIGPIPSCGSRKRPGSFGPAGDWSSSATRPSRSCARPTRARSRSVCCARTRISGGSSGRARTRA